MAPPTPDPRRQVLAIGVVLGLGMAVRIAYVIVQPSSDPMFATPMLDGAYYVERARAWVTGEGGPAGAFYLAPLYPALLAVFLGLAGERFGLLYVLQHAAVVCAAAVVWLGTRRRIGEAAAVAAASLILLYHPAMFFASRPIGEPLSLMLLAVAVVLAMRPAPWDAAVSGLVCGLAALARPNLLLLAPAWLAVEAIRGRWRRAAAIAAGVVIVLSPVALRNYRASGHIVPISANAGITLYHGNGPGGRGIYTPVSGLSGRLETQRQEATRMAARITGEPLDDVEADRWWGSEAIRTRLGVPLDTAGLLGRRVLLTLSSEELSLDYAPSLDRNPWRFATPVPFGAILGLALAGLWLLGGRRSGGAVVWSAVLAATAAPLVFYVSSRYRLPLAFLLCIPAGTGLAAIAGLGSDPLAAKVRLRGAAIVLAVMLLSWSIPTASYVERTEPIALANRGVAWATIGRFDEAERDLRTAVERDPEAVPALYNYAVVLDRTGGDDRARELYRRVVERDPSHAEAAGNLAAILVREGRPDEAVDILRRALVVRPEDPACRANLVVALAAAERWPEAREAVREAVRHGVEIEPALVEWIEVRAPPARSTEKP